MDRTQSAERPAVLSHQNPPPDSAGSASIASGTQFQPQAGWQVHTHVHFDRRTSSSAEIEDLRRKLNELNQKLNEKENQMKKYAEDSSRRIFKLQQESRKVYSRLKEKETELEKERVDGKLEKERLQARIDKLWKEKRDLKQQLCDYETVTSTLFDEMEERSKTWKEMKTSDSFKRLTKSPEEELARKKPQSPPSYPALSPSSDAPEIRPKTPSKKKSMQTIRFRRDPDADTTISGLTVLDQELFIVRSGSPVVTVYSSKTLSFARPLTIPNLLKPGDIAACEQNRCLFVIDWKDFGCAKEIFRIRPDGRVVCRWSTGDDFGRLSSSAKGTLILTVTAKNQLNEYSCDDGRTLRLINITADPSSSSPTSTGGGLLACPPLHALGLPDGSFLVSCGVFDGGPTHEVCRVDGRGRRMPGAFVNGLDVPIGLASLEDDEAVIFVADLGNGRVLKLSRNGNGGFVEEETTVVAGGGGGDDQLQHPFRICVDKINRRLFAAELLMFDCIRVKDLE